MKKLLFVLIIGTLMPLAARAATVKLTIDSRSWDPRNGSFAIKEKAEQNISSLLSRIENAADKNTDINISGINITQEAAESLKGIWKRLSHFSCEDISMNMNCLRVGTNMQIRDIRIRLTNDDKLRNLIINFDRTGKIIKVLLQPEDFDIYQFMGEEESDTPERMQILDYVEMFRSYYELKDIKALENVFSEHALIITGQKVTKTLNTIKERPRPRNIGKTHYNVLTKEEYIKRLTGVFKSTDFIKLEFDSIEVKQDGVKGNYYLVTLRQKWHSQNKQGNTYMDDGILYLLWDFSKPDEPKINVRTWTSIYDKLSFDDYVLY